MTLTPEEPRKLVKALTKGSLGYRLGLRLVWKTLQRRSQSPNRHGLSEL